MGAKKKIAVIGGGISGLGAAYLLREAASITLYEKNDYIGGHSRTLEIDIDGKRVPVDTGFIVYNQKNYPHLTRLFAELEVPVVKSDMSFGVSIGKGWLEYASNGWRGFFGGVRNIVHPKFWIMLRDIMRFNRLAPDYLNAPPEVTLGICLDEMGVGEWFRKYYLLPMGGSIWSCPIDQMLNFPASSLIRFFQNHGLLTVSDHPQWYSVLGGSREYVKRLLKQMEGNLEIRLGAVRVKRNADGNSVSVWDASGEMNEFDEVVIASHPNEALELVDHPTDDEVSILSAFRYQPNEVVLHTDTALMPKRRSAWASWVYLSESREDNSPNVSLSYWMNNLQHLDTEIPVIVTLNPSTPPREDLVMDRHVFDHPVFNEKAILAQAEFMKIQGCKRIWYCGAYQRNGFHEDGLWSAVRLAEKMGICVEWK